LEGYHFIGVGVMETLVYEDRNNDGSITAEDYTIMEIPIRTLPGA
jgi:hypothetical protein